MKRVVIVCVLIAAMIFVSSYSTIRLSAAKDKVTEQAEKVRAAFLSGDMPALANETEAPVLLWEKEETALLHYVHHDRIEEIGFSIARIPALINGEQVQLFEELDLIVWQIKHVWHSERPALDNVL